MSIDRRRFIELTGLGAAAWVVGASGGRGVAGAQGVTLELTIWGGFLYAFPKDRSRLELGSLTGSPPVAGCATMAHEPWLQVTSGTLDPKSPIDAGAIPLGEYTLAVGASAAALVAEGLGGETGECPADGVPRSLAHLPRLDAPKGQGLGAWRSRFRTRFVFGSGRLRGERPLEVADRAVPRWTVRGPGGSRGPFAFTDTTVLTVNLPDSAARFERTQGGAGWFALLPPQGSNTIRAVLCASPVDASLPDPAAGDVDPHFCRLYAAFDPAPGPKERDDLYFADWCPGDQVVSPSAYLAQVTSTAAFDPAKICSGAWLEVP